MLSQSKSFDVHGFVRNEPDGSVLVDVEGTSAEVAAFKKQIESRCPGHVDETKVDSRDPCGRTSGFQIEQ